jgi:hypothetical protein
MGEGQSSALTIRERDDLHDAPDLMVISARSSCHPPHEILCAAQQGKVDTIDAFWLAEFRARKRMIAKLLVHISTEVIKDAAAARRQSGFLSSLIGNSKFVYHIFRSLLTIADGNSGFAIIVRQLRHDEEAFAAADIATRRRRLQATAAILATGAAFFNVSFGAIPAIDAIFSHLIAPLLISVCAGLAPSSYRPARA